MGHYGEDDELAKTYGMSKSECARDIFIGNKIKLKLTPKEAYFFRKLIGVSNNLNQLAWSPNRDEELTKNIMEALKVVDFAIDNLQWRI